MELFLTKYLSKVGVGLLMFSTVHCADQTAPVFRVKGDQNVLKDIKVNVELLASDRAVMGSIFSKGKQLPLNYNDALRHHVYISYKDSLFYLYQVDNLHGKIKDELVNDIILKQASDDIIVYYHTRKASKPSDGNLLLPAKDFFLNENVDKKKFITFYKSHIELSEE